MEDFESARGLAQSKTWRQIHLLEKLFLLCLLFSLAAHAEVPAGWSTNLTAALADAGTNQKPVLAFFTASWCGPCKLMGQTTLKDDAVQRTLAGFNCVALDIDQFPKLAEEHGVRAVPTFALLSPAGDEINRTTGYQQPDDFVQWLTNGVATAKETASRQERFREQLAKVDQLLATKEEDSLTEAAKELFDFCAERDGTIAQAATERLKLIATNNPLLLLPGLLQPELATRIQVANVLRARLGDNFDADPWSDAAERQKAVARWREKLAGAPKPAT